MLIRVLLICVISGMFFSNSQAPSGINYQAVVRDADGVLYDNQNLTVYFRLIVLETSNIVWEEKHNIETNEFGVFNSIVGFGESTFLGTASNFEDVNWGEGSMFMKVDIDFDNEGGQPPVSFGESQLLSVPYALYSKSSGDHHWALNDDGVIEPATENAIINLSFENTQISSDFIHLGNENTIINNQFSEISFLENNNLLIQMSNGEINTFVQINSLDPINSSHLATKNYVDLRDDDIILQMNSAFEENINFFQSQIDILDTQVINLEQNVNDNSQAYYTLQDILYANDQSLQDQVDLASSILQTLENNINANISLQNQVDNMQNQINTLSIAIQQLQELIIEE